MNKFEKISYKQWCKDCLDRDEVLMCELQKFYDDIKLPKRATIGSGGYDIFAPYDITIPPKGTVKVPAGIRVILDDDKLKLEVTIDSDKINGAVDGSKVQVRLLEQLPGNYKYTGEVIKVLGHKNDPGVDILSIVYKYNIAVDFPEEVDEELKSIPEEDLEHVLSIYNQVKESLLS